MKEIMLFALMLVESLFVFVIRGNMCMFLKMELNFLEVRAIAYYHFFQLSVYVAAFLGGKCCLRHLKKMMFFGPVIFAGGIAMLGFSINKIKLGDTPANRAMFMGAFVLIGIAHGIQMASTLKLLDSDSVRGQLNKLFLVTLVTDAIGFCVITKLNKFPIFVGLGAAVVLLQFLVMIVFCGDDTSYDVYSDAFQGVRCIVYSWFQKLMGYAEQSVKMRSINYRESKKARKLRELREAALKRKKAEEYAKNPPHFLNACVGKFDVEYVSDLKEKWELNKLFVMVPFIWIGVEMQYSYWIFSVNRMDKFFIRPPQLILAAKSITIIVFLPIFILFLNMVLRYAKFHTALHRMSFGGLFVVFATSLALGVINMQEAQGNRPNEPYFDQVQQRVLRGIQCRLSFNEKVYVHYQQAEGTTDKSIYEVKGVQPRTAPDSNSEWRTAFVAFDLDGFVFEWSLNTFFDVVRYYIRPMYTDQYITVFPYDCPDYDAFDYHLAVNKSFMGKTKIELVFVAPPTPAQPRVYPVVYKRHVLELPGLRFFFGNSSALESFEVWKNDKLVLNYSESEGFSHEIHWFEHLDGPNLNFSVNSHQFVNNYTFRRGGLYDIVFTANQKNVIDMMDVYVAETPVTMHIRRALPQYILIGIGEVLFGMTGIQFLCANTPPKFRYHVMLDWYLALGAANAIILVFLYSGYFVTAYWQASAFTLMVVLGYTIFFYLTFWFPFFEPEFEFSAPVKEDEEPV